MRRGGPAGVEADSLPTEVDAAVAHGNRQRERLQDQLELLRTQLAQRDYRLRNAKAELERTKATLGYRTERGVRHTLAIPARPVRRVARLARRAVGRVLRLVRLRPGAGASPARDARSAIASPGGDGEAAAGNAGRESARAVFADRLSRRPGVKPITAAVLAADSLTVTAGTVDDPAIADAIARAWRSLGAAGLDVVPARSVPSARTRAFDVALLLTPGVDLDRLAAQGVVTVAWVAGTDDPWLREPRLDDVDIVLVADEPTRTTVERSFAKTACVSPSPMSPDGAAVLRDALGRWAAAPHVAIHIGPLTRDAGASWGDTPFGRATQRAFERRGWTASLHVYAERDQPAAVHADLALHIFGVRAPAVRPGQPSVLWVISHPDFVTRSMACSYDVIGVASDHFMDDLRAWLGADAPPLVSLHQATDPARFRPEPGGPHHELLFVGSSRKVRRPILDHLQGTSHDLAVYGGNWTDDLIDLRHVRGTWIPNDELHRYYAGADIVLSDYWTDMREEGFIANRTYDALAAGAFVLSEWVDGIDAEFDDGVATYRTREELLAAVDHYLAYPEERRAFAERGHQAVVARHTFDHRVAAIIDAVTPILADLRDGAPAGRPPGAA